MWQRKSDRGAMLPLIYLIRKYYNFPHWNSTMIPNSHIKAETYKPRENINPSPRHIVFEVSCKTDRRRKFARKRIEYGGEETKKGSHTAMLAKQTATANGATRPTIHGPRSIVTQRLSNTGHYSQASESPFFAPLTIFQSKSRAPAS